MIEIKTGISESGYTEVILPEKINVLSLRAVITGAYELLSIVKNNEP